MDAGNWIAIGAAVVGIAAAGAAWWQAAAAAGSRKDAKEAQEEAETARDAALELSRKATAAAERQAEAQEEANRLLAESHELSKRAAPPAWSQGRQLGEAHIAFDNTSGRHIIVTSLLVEPDEYGNLMKAAPRPHRVEHGDAFAVAWEQRYSLPAPRKLTIIWRYEDESEEQETERSL